MKKVLLSLFVLFCTITDIKAQNLKFMEVIMGSPTIDFQTKLKENGFDDPVKQGTVDFYKNGQFEEKQATVAIYNNDADKISRIVVYIEVENDSAANALIKDLAGRFLAQNKGYILKDLSQTGKILQIFSKKDDYSEYIAIEFTAGEPKMNIQFMLAQ
jgi:Cu2+-containing amine oxidase